MIIEDFEALSIADLNGQNGWSGSDLYDVQSSVVQEGSKAVSIASGPVDIVKEVAFNTTGSIVYYQRNTSAGCRRGFQLYNGVDRITDVMSYSGSNWQILSSAGFSVITSETANTWTKIEIEWSATQIRARVNDGTWTSWLSPFEGSVGTPDRIKFVAFSGTSGTTYYDNITSDDVISGAPAQNSNFLAIM